MVQPVIVDVSPNKENITFNCMAIPNEKEAVSHLKWPGLLTWLQRKEKKLLKQLFSVTLLMTSQLF